jgi:hypothetical protein
VFKLKQSDSYSWPVKVQLPASGGSHEDHTFDAEFKRVSQTRIKLLAEQIENRDISDQDLCKEILLGWNGIQDEGKEIPFSETARNQLLDIQCVAGAIVAAFFESISGAKRKN